MNRRFSLRLLSLLPIVAAIITGTTGCSKHGNSIPAAIAGYKITLTQGGGQTDTTGNMLKTPLIFKVAYNGDTIRFGYVHFVTYNCDNIPQTVEYPIGKDAPSIAIIDLFVQYRWSLNGMTGTQTLKAVLLDSLKVPRDSVLVSATALAPGKGWYVSGCSPPQDDICRTFCQTPGGRVFTGYNLTDYPYYSDDDGATWHALTTFPGKYQITRMIATPQNDVFLSVSGVGMFYSPDGGTSWSQRNNGLPDPSYFYGAIQYTKSGKLFVFTGVGTYLSPDKGQNWHLVSYGLSSVGGFNGACSTSDSTLFALNNDGLVQSVDGGEDWTPVYSLSSTAYPGMLFIDDNDDIYIGVAEGFGPYGLYVSKDHAQTWTKVYTPTPVSGFDYTLSSMMKQGGAYYFYSTSENMLIKTSDFVSYTTINPPVSNDGGRESEQYIVTADGHYILSTFGYGIYYYIPQ